MAREELWQDRSLEEAAAYAAAADPLELCATLQDLTGAHEADFDRSLDLVGSHGLMSPRARAMLGTGLIDKMRQAGLPGSRAHTGGHWIDRIEAIAVGLARRLFGVAFAELRPLSCAMANGIVFAALASRGDTILAQARRHGADPSITPSVFGDLLGYLFVDLPYDENRFTVDVEKAVRRIEETRPRLVVFGSAHILFPYAIEPLARAAERVAARVFYDGAHAVGLAAGGSYQQPAAEGAHVITGSAPKTLCGPTGGIILTNDPAIAAAVEATTSRLVSSYPNSHTAALAVTFAEMLQFGRQFAADTVANARALAQALDREGLSVLAKERGFTESHLVLVRAPGADAAKAAARLEAAGMFTTPVRLPFAVSEPGLRFGTASVTRRGMGREDMRTTASLIRRVLLEGEEPATVARDVADLASSFPTVRYCFPD